MHTFHVYRLPIVKKPSVGGTNNTYTCTYSLIVSANCQLQTKKNRFTVCTPTRICGISHAMTNAIIIEFRRLNSKAF